MMLLDQECIQQTNVAVPIGLWGQCTTQTHMYCWCILLEHLSVADVETSYPKIGILMLPLSIH